MLQYGLREMARARDHPGQAGPVSRDRPTPLLLPDDDLDFDGHDHHNQRQERKVMYHGLPPSVEPAGQFPPAFSC
jgi:hypothetical protein